VPSSKYEIKIIINQTKYGSWHCKNFVSITGISKSLRYEAVTRKQTQNNMSVSLM
jgi:hypothetical protein